MFCVAAFAVRSQHHGILKGLKACCQRIHSACKLWHVLIEKSGSGLQRSNALIQFFCSFADILRSVIQLICPVHQVLRSVIQLPGSVIQFHGSVVQLHGSVPQIRHVVLQLLNAVI